MNLFKNIFDNINLIQIEIYKKIFLKEYIKRIFKKYF